MIKKEEVAKVLKEILQKAEEYGNSKSEGKIPCELGCLQSELNFYIEKLSK